MYLGCKPIILIEEPSVKMTKIKLKKFSENKQLNNTLCFQMNEAPIFYVKSQMNIDAYKVAFNKLIDISMTNKQSAIIVHETTNLDTFGTLLGEQKTELIEIGFVTINKTKVFLFTEGDVNHDFSGPILCLFLEISFLKEIKTIFASNRIIIVPWLEKEIKYVQKQTHSLCIYEDKDIKEKYKRNHEFREMLGLNKKKKKFFN